MTFYYLISVFVIITIAILVAYSLVIRKKNIPLNLFVEALKDENNGHFEQAVIAYETALNAFKKAKSHKYNNLKNKIIEKLKILRTLIEYKNSFYK
ncbi:MAG TPA: hypothetical protein VKT28_15905 [Puia sp.]|nr:hypothetical protein [Puia sp.]